MRNCEGDPEKLKGSITNVVNHYQNDHSACHHTSRCKTDVNYESSKILMTDKKAELFLSRTLRQIQVYRSSAEDYTVHGHIVTMALPYYVESFNNAILQYQDKRINFTDDTYVFRTNLAILDWNETVNRPATSVRPPSDTLGRQRTGKTYLARNGSIGGQTAQRFVERLDERLNVPDTSRVGGYPEAPLAYDAVWALALALNKTAEKLKEKGLAIEDFNYTNSAITQELYSAMNSTRFLGVSGNVAFSSQGDRIAWTKIEQMINGTYYELGYYDQNSDNLTWTNAERWAGGHPPPDRMQQKPVLRVVSLGLFLSMCGLATVGIMAGFGCLVFNTLNRKRRCIAYSQPNINSIVVIGCMLCLFCVFLLGLDGQFISESLYPFVCQSRAWLLSLGFSLGYGGMFSKVWTVHRLTTARKKDNKKINYCVLHSVLLSIVAVDVIVLTTWQILDPMFTDTEVFDLEPSPTTDQDIMLRPYLEHCNSSNISIWLGVVFGYKGILLLFGIFLAYETRSVKLKLVNDSRFVGMSIYNVVVLCVITAPITLIIKSQQDASFAFVALAIILCSFLSMGLIFGPKVIEVMRNPKRSTLEVRSLTESVVGKEEEERHQKLLTENEQLKQQISEMEERVLVLNQQLQEKMRQRVQLSAHDRTPEVTANHRTPSISQPPAPPSPTSKVLIRTPDDVLISADYYSDSGVATASKSPRTSPPAYEDL